MIRRNGQVGSGGRAIVASVVSALALLAGAVLGGLPRAEARESFEIAVRERRITVKATDAPLDRVLNEVARRTGIVISGSSSLPEKRLTVEFHDIEIDAALARLLSGHDYIFLFADEATADAASRPRLSEVRVFTDGTTAAAASSGAVQPARLQAPATVAFLLDSLGHPERTTRVTAIEALARQEAQVPIDRVVRLGLGHDDPFTRLAVLTSGFVLPADVVLQHALHDASPAVRAEALVQLPRSDVRAEAVARTAAEDPDPSVQLVAQEVLMMLRPAAETTEAPEITE
jgi:type II secretory pathway component GspD/PulD (secretin)